MDNNHLTKKQQEELQKLADEMSREAKSVRLDYKDNPSVESGSRVYIHQNSPFLKEKHERLIKFDKKDLVKKKKL